MYVQDTSKAPIIQRERSSLIRSQSPTMSQHHKKISGECTYYRGAAWFLAWCWIAIFWSRENIASRTMLARRLSWLTATRAEIRKWLRDSIAWINHNLSNWDETIAPCSVDDVMMIVTCIACDVYRTNSHLQSWLLALSQSRTYSDMPLYQHCSRDDAPSITTMLEHCIKDINHWMHSAGFSFFFWGGEFISTKNNAGNQKSLCPSMLVPSVTTQYIIMNIIQTYRNKKN